MIDPAVAVKLMRAEGNHVVLTVPGEITEDIDGIPSWISPSTVTGAMLGPPILTGAEWETVARYLLAQLTEMENNK